VRVRGWTMRLEVVVLVCGSRLRFGLGEAMGGAGSAK